MKLPHVIPSDTNIRQPVTLLGMVNRPREIAAVKFVFDMHGYHDTETDLTDIAPTVLDYLLGSTAMKKFACHGQSLRPLVENKPPNAWQVIFTRIYFASVET